jgi:hypothetical protein
MERKSVGYFEGTDPAVLTSLICAGCDTIPISNGLDSHGTHIRLLNEETKLDVLIGYFHKVYAPVGAETQAEDMFHVCQTYGIPFLLVVPREQHACAREKLDTCPEVVEFVDPADLLDAARRILDVYAGARDGDTA